MEIMNALGVLLESRFMILRLLICTIKAMIVQFVVVGHTDKVSTVIVIIVQPGVSIPMTILTRETMIKLVIVKSVHLVNIKTLLPQVLAKTVLQVHQEQYMEMMAFQCPGQKTMLQIILMIVLCVHRVNIKMAMDKLHAKLVQQEHIDQ